MESSIMKNNSRFEAYYFKSNINKHGCDIMRFEQLQQIIEIEKYNSISKAAEVLYMTQPSLSHSLSVLEKEIGIDIFQRNAKGVIPTPEGKEILTLAKEIIERQNRILDYGKQEKFLNGAVTILICPVYGFLESEILIKFKTRFPNAKLNFIECSPDQIIEKMHHGLANIGIIMDGFFPNQKPLKINEAAIQAEQFGQHSMHIFVNQYSPLVHMKDISVEQLRKEHYIFHTAEYWGAINEILHPENAPIIVTDCEKIKYLVYKGEGATIMPDVFALYDVYCENNWIQSIPTDDKLNLGKSTDYLIYSAKKKLTLLEQNTLDLLREILTDMMLCCS